MALGLKQAGEAKTTIAERIAEASRMLTLRNISSVDLLNCQVAKGSVLRLAALS